TALFFYFLARRLIVLAVGTAASPGVIRVGAVVAAMAWSLHPLRVESVAWAAERRDALSGLMFVLTLLAYLRYVMASGRRRAAWFEAALSAYLLCLLSKAIAMTLPGVLLILDAYPLRRLSGWRVWIETIPFAVFAIGVAIVAIVGQRRGALLQSV